MNDWDNSVHDFCCQLDSIGLNFSTFDYVILNHLEPDHADLINWVREQNPQVKITSTAKGIAMAEKFFKVKDNLCAVKICVL